jgi:hypothetical protein
MPQLQHGAGRARRAPLHIAVMIGVMAALMAAAMMLMR